MHRSLIISFFLSLSLLVTPDVFPQSPDYPAIFGNDWKKAEEFLKENQVWIAPMMKKYDLSYKEGVAVIFPELVRYSALRDKMEITLLKTLYINLGKDYANFSIGQFQMKPYFAEKIRETASEMPFRKLRRQVLDSAGYSDIKDYRASIVYDLEDIKKQAIYLVLFMKICNEKFNISGMNETERVKFLATAYNAGFYKTEEEIRMMTDRKYFSTKLIPRERYSYSDISVYWYTENRSDR